VRQITPPIVATLSAALFAFCPLFAGSHAPSSPPTGIPKGLVPGGYNAQTGTTVYTLPQDAGTYNAATQSYNLPSNRSQTNFGSGYSGEINSAPAASQNSSSGSKQGINQIGADDGARQRAEQQLALLRAKQAREAQATPTPVISSGINKTKQPSAAFLSTQARFAKPTPAPTTPAPATGTLQSIWNWIVSWF